MSLSSRNLLNDSDLSPSFRVVVIDDNHSASYLLGRLLGKLGHQVEIANSAEHSVELVHQFHPELFISDIEMPEMSGYELAQRIRCETRGERPFLVALTGYGQASDRAAALESGFDEHLVKPISLTALRSLIQKVSESVR
ncbi:MAG TPA: response regulator [Planctomicrobium sp.]|nr:response regulator [Planctomicrobium sp.]